MTQLPLIQNDSPDADQPLPLIVAQKWGFSLARAVKDGITLYAIQDWMRGLTGETDTRYILTKFKATEVGRQMWSSIPRLPYKAADGKTYQREYVDDKGLYIIAQYMRVTQERPVLDEIRRFLAAAGAFVDEIRRDPEKLTANVSNPDTLLDQFIEYHRKRGMDDRWIQKRIESKIKRNQFTTALTEFVQHALTPRHYATATDDVYRGLWSRTASQLKIELHVPAGGTLRDHQPTLALHYQGITEEVCALKLGERQEVTWDEAREIIQAVATIIGRQARETSELLQTDIATGRPLLQA